jgi:hypothetical protein
VWLVQKDDPRIHRAITGKGPTPPSVEILCRPWLERLDEWVKTAHGDRLLARGGVLALSAADRFEFKGGWILAGSHWSDPAKDDRSGQLHRYGFS